MKQYRFIAALVLVWMSAAAAAQEVQNLSTVMKNDVLGIEDGTKKNSEFLNWATQFVRFRRAPDGPGGRDFLRLCAHDNNILCGFNEKPLPPAKLAAAPAWIRTTYYKALSAIAQPRDTKVKACRANMTSLRALLSDKGASRVHPRILYWLWACDKEIKQFEASQPIVEKRNKKGQVIPPPKKEVTPSYLEELWQKYPFDYHTQLALNQSNDTRLLDLARNQSELTVRMRSVTHPESNDKIAALEALHKLKQDTIASDLMESMSKDFAMLEPDVRLYLVALAARISKGMSSVLLVARQATPLLTEHREYLTAETARLLFPVDYPLFDSLTGRYIPAIDLVEFNVRLPEFNRDPKIDASLLVALIYAESGFNSKIISSAGAVGLAQIMPNTGSEQYRAWMRDKNQAGEIQIQVDDGAEMIDSSRLSDPSTSLGIGTRYLKALRDDFKGSTAMALASYNGGEGLVQNWLKKAPKNSDPQFAMDLLLMNEPIDYHVSDYVLSILGKEAWYKLLYQ